jgi:hypothetical protein
LKYVAFQPAFDEERSADRANVARSTEFLQHPIKELIKSFESTRLWHLQDQDSLHKLIDVFKAGVHRVLVTTTGVASPSEHLVSQKDLIRYVSGYGAYRRESPCWSPAY